MEEKVALSVLQELDPSWCQLLCQDLDPKTDAALERNDRELGTMPTVCTQALSLRPAHQWAMLSLKCTCLRRKP